MKKLKKMLAISLNQEILKACLILNKLNERLEKKNAILLLYLGITKTETPVLEKLFTDHLNKDRLIILYTKATLYTMVGIALTVECKIITFTDDREFISRELRSKFNLIENHKSKPSIRAFKTKKFQKLDFEKQLNS